MIARTARPRLLEMISKYPVLGVLGPRQSGKTTLVRNAFPDFTYISLETPDNKEYATKDPRGFLDRYKSPAIFDEVQNVPELFSYIQERVDAGGESGQYILTGSQNFILNEKISQTLAGRIYLINLPTFTQEELKDETVDEDWKKYALKGTYPRIWDKRLTPEEWYPSYIQTYLERDVRNIKNIPDLRDFQTFLKLCAGRIGQTTILSSLANEIGVSHNTIKSWISVLEASYLIFLLKPYYKNFNKRLTKSPKLYFFDTGLAVNLLNITNPNQIETHPLKGNIFENLVISEIAKSTINKGKSDLGYFIRDKTGNEVDYVSEKGGFLSLVEIKASKTLNTDHLKGIEYWENVIRESRRDSFLVYAGNEEKTFKSTKFIRWNNISQIIT
ncbi:ATP-binding protein [Patescibacteria group bacterium]|nr:ATP-binding protein [Patescibacteria group bacterium]MBU1952598.1 ATP-binding protein [Patescibacteria group bacterium]